MHATSMCITEAIKFLLLKGTDKFLLNKAEKDTLDITLNVGHYETSMLITVKPLVTSGILDTDIRIIHKAE